MAQQRIVSLLPSCTGIVCVLGCADRLVGRSHECDFPAEVRRLPICTETALDPARNSAVIDREVKSLLQRGLSLYRVNAGLLRKLRPDLILTQAQCDICAVTENELAAATPMLDFQPQILSLSPARFADVWTDLGRVAAALGIPDHGKEVIRALKHRVAAVIEKACQQKRKPSVACLEWLDPLMAAGNWVPDLVELAGGENLFGESGRHSPWLEWGAFAKADPEVIVAMPCGFDLARTRLESPALTGRAEWKKLRAVKHGRVYLADGNQFFNRPGPRLVESLEILAEILHPGAIKFGHEGKAWQRLLASGQ